MKSRPREQRLIRAIRTQTLIFTGAIIILLHVNFTPKNKILTKASCRSDTIPVPEAAVGKNTAITHLAAGREGVLICRDYYALLYNEAREQADWVAYKITPEMIKGNAKRKNNFKPDPLVPEGSAHPNDYKKTVFDRGHLMPAASCKFNQKAMDETFYMSNISPQYNYFNRGIWRLIEIQIRDWAVELGALYIVTGPAAYFPDSVIGKNQVSVPSHYYKVVMIDDSISVHMAGFLLKNEKSSLRPRDYLVSVDSVEVFTGLDFFPELADSIESEAEHKIDTLFQRK